MEGLLHLPDPIHQRMLLLPGRSKPIPHLPFRVHKCMSRRNGKTIATRKCQIVRSNPIGLRNGKKRGHQSVYQTSTPQFSQDFGAVLRGAFLLPDAEDRPTRGGISRRDAEAQRFLKTNFSAFQYFSFSLHLPLVGLAMYGTILAGGWMWVSGNFSNPYGSKRSFPRSFISFPQVFRKADGGDVF